jgi:SulP family sulfate permease
LVLRPLFENLAQAALAAIVVFAMSGMADLAYFRLLWKLSPIEFLLAVVAFLGVLTFGVLQGVVIAVVMSLVLLVRHIGNPPSSVLGRSPSGFWYAIDERPDAAQIDGLLVWRQEAPLVFLNARRLVDRARTLVTDDIEVLVVDASVVSAVDTTGLTAFMALSDELRAHGIDVWVVHPLARTWARAKKQAAAWGSTLPPMFESIDGAARAFETRDRGAIPHMPDEGNEVV